MRVRPPPQRPPGSRAFVDEVLAELRAARWSLRGWARFLARSMARSAAEAIRRPAAAAEVTALHAAVGVLRRGWWAPVSWFLAITHLGLLGERSTLGWANRLSLVRGLVPAAAPRQTVLGVITALATDWADGRLARQQGPTAFGFYADALADAAFWTWFTLRHERSPAVRTAAVATWGVPVLLVATASFAGGRAVDYPRPVLLRNASVALQIAVAARALRVGAQRCTPAVVEARGARRRVSYMRTATTTPDTTVNTATVQIAAARPTRSPTTPASSAPAANPRSRHSR